MQDTQKQLFNIYKSMCNVLWEYEMRMHILLQQQMRLVFCSIPKEYAKYYFIICWRAVHLYSRLYQDPTTGGQTHFLS
jgi:hypothetical protein